MKLLVDATFNQAVRQLMPGFSLTVYHSPTEAKQLLADHDVLLCRSTLSVNEKFLANSKLQCVATATSGVDHIDYSYLAAQNITLFDAKGCNARAVADYVVAILAYLASHNQIPGNQAGVIGVGEAGSRVVERLIAMGFEVFCYDPLKTLHEPHLNYIAFEQLSSCNVLCIHANLHTNAPHASFNLLQDKFLKLLMPNTVIINTARGDIINETALLRLKQPLTYCTDVYSHEPAISSEIVAYSTLCTPHIAGHSVEGKQAAIEIVCNQLRRYFRLESKKAIQHAPIAIPVITGNNWQDIVLQLFNPERLSTQLKQAKNKQQAFVTLRQTHQNRHDFNLYAIDCLNEKTKAILGIT